MRRGVFVSMVLDLLHYDGCSQSTRHNAQLIGPYSDSTPPIDAYADIYIYLERHVTI